MQVLQQMTSGMLQVGSRAPVQGAPTWVTLEVLAGGFASGNFCAALTPTDEPNDAQLTAEGAAKLAGMLDSGLYDIAQPEHAALPVVVHLLRTGHQAEAEAVLGAIRPWFDRLRFFPAAAPSPVQVTPQVSVATVGDLRAVAERVRADRSNVNVWRTREDMAQHAMGT